MDNFTTAKVYTTAANTSTLSSSSSIEKDKKSNDKNGDDISLYKPITYLNNTTSSSSTTTASATMVKHKITNNFKLPPFPVYVPSTTFSSSSLNLQSTTDPGSNNEASNKIKDTLESVSSTINPTSISHLSSVSSSVSPSGLNTTLSLGRINPYLYQSESSLSNNSNNVTMTTSITSSNTNNELTASYTSPFLDQKPNYNNVCSSATLPKSSSTNDSYVSKLSHSIGGKSSEFSSGNDSSYSYKYSTDYYSNITTTNNSSINGTSTFSSASDNIYRVQYSATNPFLDPLDSATPPQTDTNGISSIFSKATATARNGASSMVSEIARKFEKLDFDEDLK